MEPNINFIACIVQEMSTFCFILWLIGLVLTTVIVVILVVYIYKYLKDNIVVRKSKIDMDAEIIKNLRELVRADEECRRRSPDTTEKNRTYKYKKTGESYELTSKVNS